MNSLSNPIYQLFDRAAKQYPKELAVLDNGVKLSYGQLEEKVRIIYHQIIAHANEELIIGLSTTRGVDQIIFMLAILKSGKAYLPLDFKYPKSRISKIINSANLNFCLATPNEAQLIEDTGLKSVTNDNKNKDLPLRQQPIMAKHGGYILYTSGSTGEPKGVCMHEKALVNLIKWQNKNSTSKNGTRTLQFAPLSFDVSFQEIMSTLSTGGTLVLVDEALRLDMFSLVKYIEEKHINRLFLPFVALQALAESAISGKVFPQCLKEIMTAGEQLKITDQLRGFFTKLGNCVLYNQYGPTECHVVTELKLEGSPKNWPQLPTIGKPIDNTEIFILDKELRPTKNGETGELCIAGECLAQGYLGKKELTKEKFVFTSIHGNEEIRVYRTGDIARYLPDGNIEFLGREDEQVKISGHRIELGEVEIALEKIPNVQQAVVVVSNQLSTQNQLIAYLQSSKPPLKDIGEFKELVAEVLPEYMLPSHYIWVEDFPRTSSGKINKKALPKPKYQRPSSSPAYKKPVTEIEKNIARNWTEIFGIPQIGIDDSFFEMGGTSLIAQKTVASMRQMFGYDIPIIKLYQYPTISELAKFLQPKENNLVGTKKAKKKSTLRKDVAIIGMAGRFPGSNSIQELWETLKDGKETISFFSPDELDSSIPELLRNDPLYVRARGIVDSAKSFDSAFFGLNPKLAEAMDPQQRLFLEIAYEVLEQSGHLPSHYNGSIGVYAGTGMNTYFKNNVLPNKDVMRRVGDFVADTLNQKDYISTRIAYHLNLGGPAVSIHSACSTSLLAIAEAVEAIRNDRCDVAIAGGSSITTPMYSGHLYQEGSMLSPDGRCRPFDQDAQGTIFSDGAGVLLLKNLENAQNDGDIIHGIIKGIGVNNDGGNKASFTAPSVEGQAGAISRALFDAEINPSQISYIEAHGTATPIGDPIEVEGLKTAFGEQDKKGYCAIGSIKSNIGHLTAAAGVAGTIKTVLALKKQQIPPSLGFKKSNPSINFDESPFYVNDKLRPWESEGPRRAGISSFGVGGTNVHIIIEEYKETIGRSDQENNRSVQLLTWSAKTASSLKGYQAKLGHFLEHQNRNSIADIAYALSTTRDTFGHRGFLVSDSVSDAKNQLLSTEGQATKTKHVEVLPDAPVFLFPGQGSQYLQMGKSLYEEEKEFKDAIDLCATILEPLIELDIRTVIYPEKNTLEAEDKLRDTKYTQPALFVVEYALAQLWMSWGIQPKILCGHSIGEFVAAHLAGILSLEDALHLIAIRGRLVSPLPSGRMLSVRASIEDIENLIPKSLSIAAINSDRLIVISGENEEIRDFANILDKNSIANKVLFTSHAFHSSMMDPILDTFKKEVAKLNLNIPRIPIISTVTGNWMTESEAMDPEYWANHLRATVRFSTALETMLNIDDIVLLEVGPGRALTTLSMQKKGLKSLASIPSLPLPNEGKNAHYGVLSALGDLWVNGIAPDWGLFHGKREKKEIWLPSYAFDRKPCWLDIEPKVAAQNGSLKNLENIMDVNITKTSKTDIESVESMRKTQILEKIAEIIEDNSGIEIDASQYDLNFLELGLDSLVLTQMAINLKNQFKSPITFRQLNGELGSPNLLAEHLDKVMPNTLMAVPKNEPQANIHRKALPTEMSAVQPSIGTTNDNSQVVALDLMAQQIQLLGKQIELLRGNNLTKIPTIQHSHPPLEPLPTHGIKHTDLLTDEEKREHQKPFGASPKIEKKAADLNMVQTEYLEALTERYTAKTAGSKKYAQEHRQHMSDPRVVSGFKPLTKELVYPLVVEKSSGNTLWDIDGNRYIDVLNSFGACLFGHQPDFIKKAIHEQVELGFEVGPQHPLAGEVCKLLCEFTDQDRAALCNTGSEAVLGAMRIARTVTGRSLIVAFSKSYHGINDEVIVRGSKKLRSFPAASGILPEAVKNMLILDYGSDESLKIIRERAHEIAAVLVEPIQSRRPELRPIEFLKEVRKITEASESVLIFDEIITGFRMHPGGAQALFGIKADIGTYGKVIGGGISIGAIVGNKRCMDALDGGYWQFGDDSIPEAGVTYFAGTFVRHPLALASARASLLHMKEQGVGLQDELARKTDVFADELNKHFLSKNLPMEITSYRSLWRLKMLEEIPYAELLFVLMRDKGFHIWDGFPCYMTAAYTEDDLQNLIITFKECVDELVEVGILKSEMSRLNSKNGGSIGKLNTPPVHGARLGRDEDGNPAWFVKNPQDEDEYIKIDL